MSAVLLHKRIFYVAHQFEKLAVTTTWSTAKLDTKFTALPPVGEELLLNVQLVNETVLVTISVSSGTKLS